MSRREVPMDEYWCEYRREDGYSCDRTVRVSLRSGLPVGWVLFSGSTFCTVAHFAAHLRTLTPEIGLIDGTTPRAKRFAMETFIGRIDARVDSASRADLAALAARTTP